MAGLVFALAAYLALDDLTVASPWERNALRDSWTNVGGAYERKLCPIRSGRIDFRTAFGLATNRSIRVEFADESGTVVLSRRFIGTGEVPCRIVHDVIEPVASVRLVPEPTCWIGACAGAPFRMTVDWPVFETFDWLEDGTLPDGWTGRGAQARKTFYEGPGYWRNDPLLFIAPGGRATVGYVPNGGEKTIVAFQTQADAQVELWTRLPDGTKVCCKGCDFTFGDVRYSAVPGVWYDLRFELDSTARTTEVKLNGRTLGTIPCKDENLLKLSFANVGKVEAKVDNVKVFGRTAPTDGVPEPVVPRDSRGNQVGINVCSLWHEGSHRGWDCIANCRDPKPVLGFYDEGEGESADWEIKYLVEHGVDFQAFCWYADARKEAIKSPQLAYQLEDGYKNARWSDRMRYCLIWECANACVPEDVAVWREHYVPYLIEHHFKDPRYLRLKNRPVLFLFGGAWRLPKQFGSVEKVRAAFDYLADEVRKIGCDGMIYVASQASSAPDLAAMGFDATAAYNWGDDGYRYDVNTNSNWKNAADRSCYTIPTVSVGFNNEPWGGKRKPMMTPEELRRTLTWARDEFEPKMSAKGTWQERLFMLSTWNEYGEGTYMMPTTDERGFGYLDAVRAVFTDEPVDRSLDLLPTAAQRARMCRLYCPSEKGKSECP